MRLNWEVDEVGLLTVDKKIRFECNDKIRFELYKKIRFEFYKKIRFEFYECFNIKTLLQLMSIFEFDNKSWTTSVWP